MRFSILFFTSLVILFSCKNQSDWKEPAKSFSEISRHFKNPPSYFKTQPFWVWNTEISKEKIDEALLDFKEMGFGGVFIHPRYGLITEYLGKEWFDMYEYAVKKASELDLEIWIYDENSFPSGFAGGHVPAAMPESYNEGQGIKLIRSEMLQLEPGKKYWAIYREDKGKLWDISTDTSLWLKKKGKYLLFEITQYNKSKWYAGYSYVDLLKPGVTEKFIELTMEGYKQKLGQEFGKTVRGIFTDEPNIHPQHRNTIRWTPDLFEQFSKDWGYKLQDNLLCLFEETGPWKKVRHDYQKTLLRLFIERWAIPWYQYSEENKLIWTGHYWEHGWPGLNDGPDNMAMYSYHQMPGIDMLFNTMDSDPVPSQFGNIRAVKELSSVANQTGKKRTLSETYGASGWELTFEDMKRLGDWEYVMGVNFMNQHLSYMSIAGDRKHDFPQSFSPHNSWWKHYREQALYFSRLSLALSAGEQHNRVLLMEPTTSAWMYDNPLGFHPVLDSMNRSFHNLLVALEKHHIEYDLGCEYLMKDQATSENGKIRIGQRSYDIWTLPAYMENLDQPTFHLLKNYLEQGGRIIAFGDAPSRVDGEINDSLAQFPSVFAKQWITVYNYSVSSVLDFLLPGKIRFSGISGNAEDLHHMRRILEDGELLFLVNSSLKDPVKGTFTTQAKSVKELDLFTGEIAKYPAKLVNDQLEVEFELPPAGSALFYFSDKGRSPAPANESDTWVNLPSQESSVSPTSENILVLDYCWISLSGKADSLCYFYSAGDLAWKAHGLPDNPWVSSSQFKKEWVERDTFSPSTGFKASFDFFIAEGTELKSIKAVAERPEIFKFSINGKSLQPDSDSYWKDPDFKIFHIGEWLDTGKNTISLSVQPMSIHAELEPVFILGNFSLEPQENGFLIQPALKPKLGSWKNFGMPFYSDAVKYEKNMNLKSLPKACKIRLDEWSGTVAEVWVNDVSAGLIYLKPYEKDIRTYLKKGENTICVKVYGSLKNTLGPFHFVRRSGIVTPWSFKYAPEKQPSGKDYHLLDYGLIKDFSLWIQD